MNWSPLIECCNHNQNFALWAYFHIPYLPISFIFSIDIFDRHIHKVKIQKQFQLKEDKEEQISPAAEHESPSRREDRYERYLAPHPHTTASWGEPLNHSHNTSQHWEDVSPVQSNSVPGLLIHLLPGNDRKCESHLLPGETEEEVKTWTRYVIHLLHLTFTL